MALDMTNSHATSATLRVMVSFYPVATDNTCSSSTRTLAIHKEKFNVQLSGDEHNNLKHLKGFTGLPEIAKSKCLGEKPEVTIAMSCSFIILRYTKLFLFYRRKFKIISLNQFTIYLLAFCRNLTFKCIFLRKKNRIWDSHEKGAAMQDQDIPSRSPFIGYFKLL